ncbi:transcription termination factor 3, mitochondrial [Hylaeus anthracinus]|uniref:transcription termination factor 3, mitochondrial n=1 Tax=Hylaeus anthracinus TaxID=313031 RepID=UPI0023B9CC1C|nr:transcription termination factor 3, mitochondrial [Hylaeus anthracinus]
MIHLQTRILLRILRERIGEIRNYCSRDSFEKVCFDRYENKRFKSANDIFGGCTIAEFSDTEKNTPPVKNSVNNENSAVNDEEKALSNVLNIWDDNVPKTKFNKKPIKLLSEIKSPQAFTLTYQKIDNVNNGLPGPLDLCTEDLSHVGPYMTPTFNFAKFADKSDTIQKLVELGVKLYKLEEDKAVVEMIMSLDFDRDIKPYIRFLNDCGVQAENLGHFITNYPKIFKEDMDSLYTRIRYLRAHRFTPEMVGVIVNRNPLWLSFSVKEIDSKLSYFQHNFKLTGSNIRKLTVKHPRLITYNMQHIRENTFAVKEEMGFSKDETKHILLTAPRVWTSARSRIVDTFDYAHNEMKLSHETISKQPLVLTCRAIRLKQRHKFLEELKRNQYDPTKPLYVSLMDLINGTDIEFCTNVAKSSIHLYNMFLKTL